MSIKILSGTCSEFKAILIDIEVDISKGMPSFVIVGMADTAIKEAKERVRAAISNNGFKFPIGRITINLAPASVRKNGSMFDLPIALALLIETGQIHKKNLDDFIIFGELSLSGEIKRVNGAFPIFLEGITNGINKFIIPSANLNESELNGKTEFYPFNTLSEVVSFINFQNIEPHRFKKVKKKEKKSIYDYSHIIGQESSKRAVVISAAGKHNLLFYGPTGCGKTLLASAMPSIMPMPSINEMVEIARIYSISGLISKDYDLSVAPFRRIQNSITKAALIGGGTNIKAGEVTLANHGVLFVDELLEFNINILNTLREPLEDGFVTLNRNHGSLKLPANFILLAALNICPCGKLKTNSYQDPECVCTESEIRHYQKKLSKALIDRIDILNFVPPVSLNDINNVSINTSSSDMKEKVIASREIQKNRLKNTMYSYNSDIKGKDIFELCIVNKKIRQMLEFYFDSSKPSLRAYGKVIKLARTISDIDEKYEITQSSVIEAIEYRKDFNGQII